MSTPKFDRIPKPCLPFKGRRTLGEMADSTCDTVFSSEAWDPLLNSLPLLADFRIILKFSSVYRPQIKNSLGKGNRNH
jgi:hypothetical protein